MFSTESIRSRSGLITMVLIVTLASVQLASQKAYGVIAGVATKGSNFLPRYRNAIFAASLQLQTGQGVRCSSTIIGTHAIITSAHCVTPLDPDSGQIEIFASVGERRYQLRCNRIPEGQSLLSDIALCASDALFENIRPARLDLSYIPHPGNPITIAGWGCKEPGGIDRSTGIFSLGSTRIASPNDVPTIGSHDNVSNVSADDLSSFVLQGDSACFGDAGGGVFKPDLSSADQPLLVGIISRSDMQNLTWIESTSWQRSSEWIKSWALANVEICGITLGPGACGSGIASAAAPPICTQKHDDRDCKRSLNIPCPTLSNPGRTCKQEINDPVCEAEKALQNQRYATEKLDCDANKSASSLANRTIVVQSQDPSKTAPAPSAVDQYIHVQAKGGEKISDVFGRVCGKDAAGQLQTFLRKAASSINFVNFDIPLSEGQIIDLPPCPAVPELASAKLKLASANATDPLQYVATLSTSSTALPPVSGILSLSSPDPGADCAPSSDSNTYPYNLALLLDVLALNHARMGNPTQTAIIMIADSGLEGGMHGMFSTSVLRLPDGMDWPDYITSIEPTVINSKARIHGTEVASLALGGPIFSRLQLLNRESVRIELDIQRIYHTPATTPLDVDTPVVTADINLFGAPITGAKQDAAIVNLSLRSTVNISAIETELQDRSSPILFIAAAGNQGKQIGVHPAQNVDTIYPALYGGQESIGKERVITVTALDGQGKLARFANYGANYVDIGAPGCKVGVVAWDKSLARFKDARESGTSIAAPLVSFVAALIRSESRGWQPVQIKRQILMSADLTPGEDLSGQIKDGRQLNVVKAAAIQSDVVEMTDKTLMFGELQLFEGNRRLSGTDSIFLDCDGEQNKAIQKKDILKIAKWVPREDGHSFKIYYRDVSPLFQEDICSAPIGIHFKINDFQSETIKDIDLKNVKDIVMKLSG